MVSLGLRYSVFGNQNSTDYSRCGAYSRAALIKLMGLGPALVRGAALIRIAALLEDLRYF